MIVLRDCLLIPPDDVEIWRQILKKIDIKQLTPEQVTCYCNATTALKKLLDYDVVTEYIC